MNKNEIAVSITADWSTSEATTISKKDIMYLQETPPNFGILREQDGWKLYAFLGNIIKKHVIRVCDGKPCTEDGRAVLSKIKEYFVLNRLHRTGF